MSNEQLYVKEHEMNENIVSKRQAFVEKSNARKLRTPLPTNYSI